jgi:signal transduction histidine kinase
MGFSELLQNLFEEEKAIIGDDHNSDSKEHDNQNQKKMALDAVVRNASRLERLAKDILDVAKIESNRLTLNKERFSLTEKISNTISDIIATQIRKDGINDDNKNIKINFESKGGERGNGIFIEADKTMIQQVISNLLKNAIKFAKEGGTITITADISTPKKVEAEGRGKSEGKEGGGEAVVVEVKDTGSGIDASILPRLFTKFATSSSEGIGLGLYISKGIVEAHGGRIWAENNLDGKGATVAFILPCLVN